MALEINSAGRTFLRPGGREGSWNKNPATRDLDDAVVCPFDFVEMSGAEAEAALDSLKALRPSVTPILFGSPHEAGILFERFRYFKDTPAQLIAASGPLDLDKWVVDRQVERDEWQDREAPFPPRGPWPQDVVPSRQLHVPDELLQPGPKPVVIIGLLPTADPTETAAYLHFGGWNDCPPPPVHIAFARRWREQYGAVQVSNTYDTVEFRVARPVTDRKEALDLAMLQNYFCSDSIPGTLEESAAGLIGSTTWCFWWD